MATTVEACLTVLFPPTCGICGVGLPVSGGGLCAACREALTPNDGQRCRVCDLPEAEALCDGCTDSPFAELRAPYVYGGGLDELIAAAKFKRREDLARLLGRLLVADDAALRLAQSASALVPVPLGRQRARQRGYNQSAVIARQLARASGQKVTHALVRLRDTAAQSDLPLAERRRNVEAAFGWRVAVSGRVALVDDVVTSGETVRQAALALKAAGASEVVVLAVARTG